MNPITVCIATRNEASNIDACLDTVFRNDPAEILVVDGGSEDSTVSIAKNRGVAVLESPPLGLAWQRQVGLENATQPFIALVDAHDRLDPGCLETLLQELIRNDWHAIQAELHVLHENTYWERAYAFNARLSLNQPGSTNMVGRPCIYRSDAIRTVGFDPFFGFGVGCEDTDVSIQFERRGLRQGKGSGRSYRAMPSNFRSWWKKWMKYGRGDARIIHKYPEKHWQIRKHQLWTYPVVRASRAIRANGFRYVPFFILFGWIRFFASLQEQIRLKSGRS